MIGVTRVDLKTSGIYPDANELLMISKMVGSRPTLHSLRKVVGIGSRVQDLEGEVTMIERILLEFNKVNSVNRSGQSNSGGWVKSPQLVVEEEFLSLSTLVLK